jgi:hypothetical protein
MRHAFALVLLFTAATALADLKVSHPFESSVPSTGLRRVVIDIPAGEVRVRNGASDRITLTGYTRRNYDGSNSQMKQQRIVDDISAVIKIDRDEAVVERRFGPNATGFGPRKLTGFEVVVEVPQGLAVDVRTSFGDVSVHGTFGNVDVDLRAGDVDVDLPRRTVRYLSASVRVGDVNADFGDRTVTSEGVFPKATHFDNPAGKAIVNLHATAGDVRVRLR